jgi:hypothetical protein
LHAILAGLVLVGNFALGASTSAGAVKARCQLWFQSHLQTACWRPFNNASPFNHRLPARPKLSPQSDAVQRHMRAYHWIVQASNSDANHSFSLVPADGSRPVYFAGPSDPVSEITCQAWYGASSCQGENGVSTNGARIHVPAGAAPSANADAHMIVVETDTGDEYDLWHTAAYAPWITAATGAEENVITSDGTGDGGDAANLALTGGLLRPAELMAGRINHALVITVPCTNAYGASVGFTWPASGGWGDVCGQYQAESTDDAPPIGALFKLSMSDGQIRRSGAPRWERTIMFALAHYGAYAEDTNGPEHGGLAILTQDPVSWTSIGRRNQWATAVHKFRGRHGMLTSRVPIPTSRLQLVAPCVPRNSCPA